MRIAAAICALVALAALGFQPAAAGDSLVGKITEVRSADTVVLDYGRGRYVMHVVGIVPPRAPELAAQAREFVARLVLGKSAGLRLASFLQNGEVSGKLYAQNPGGGIDVGLALVRAGLAQRVNVPDYQLGYPYNEVSNAQREAQAARRGIWAANQPPPPR